MAENGSKRSLKVRNWHEGTVMAPMFVLGSGYPLSNLAHLDLNHADNRRFRARAGLERELGEG